MDQLTGKSFKVLLESANNNLANQHKEIDALNVFPVPDGDTGTNMNLTFTSGVTQALALKTEDFAQITKTLSRGLLMGARGNSGVILSQIFRGVSQSVEGKTSVNALDLGAAFLRGSEVAYKAVMRPVEGTILTVVREASWYANDYVEKKEKPTIEDYFEIFVKESEESLKRTPDLLPVLKEVGVLDSGGAGFVAILNGINEALKGHPVKLLNMSEASAKEESQEVGYRTEFWLSLSRLAQNDDKTSDDLLRKLQQAGENIRLNPQDKLIQVSLNTLTPGQVLNLAQRYGTFQKVQINSLNEDLPDSIVEKVIAKKEHTKYAIIAVATGKGLGRMFKDLGADVIVSGGQTMNPSTEDFVSAVDSLNADHIIILPNNGNIIMAAQQCKNVKDKLDIRVIETKTLPQGLSALISFDPESDPDTNITNMELAGKHALSGEVTYAIKDTSIDGLAIKAHDYMGIMGKQIVACDPDMMKATKELLDSLLKGNEDEYSVVTIITGEDADDTQAKILKDYVSKHYQYEVETYKGDQAVYSFIIGVD